MHNRGACRGGELGLGIVKNLPIQFNFDSLGHNSIQYWFKCFDIDSVISRITASGQRLLWCVCVLVWRIVVRVCIPSSQNPRFPRHCTVLGPYIWRQPQTFCARAVCNGRICRFASVLNPQILPWVAAEHLHGVDLIDCTKLLCYCRILVLLTHYLTFVYFLCSRFTLESKMTPNVSLV